MSDLQLEKMVAKELKKNRLNERRLVNKQEKVTIIHQYFSSFQCSYKGCMVSCPMPKNFEIDGRIYPCVASLIRSL